MSNKILIVVPSFIVGGSEKVQYLVSKYLEMDTKNEITIFFLSSKNFGNRTFWSDLKYSKIIHSNKLKEKYGIISLFKFLLFNKFNIIFSSNSHINGFLSLLKNLKILRKTKLIIRESNDVYNRFSNKKILYLYSFYHKLYRGSDKLIFQNNKMYKKFIHKNPFIKDKSIVINNPIFIKNNLRPYIAKNNSIVMIGRLNKNKNHILALKLIKELLNKNYSNIKLHIYGQGPLNNFLNQYIIKNNLENNIKIFNEYHSVDEIFNKNYSVFLHLSFFEGFPNVLLEAANFMIPCIITTNCAGGLDKIPKVVMVENKLNNLLNVIVKYFDTQPNFSTDYKDYLKKNHGIKDFTKKMLT